MKKILKIIFSPLLLVALLLIIIYKLVISPLLPHSCRYTPTCSSYAFSAMREFGFFIGGFLAFKRLCRCVPWKKGGLDPVPTNIKGDFKWVM